jgi:hypothetical protein
MDDAPTSYINKYDNAIVVNHRVGVHREFVRVLRKLKVEWRTSTEVEVIPFVPPIVGDNGESSGGFFDVREGG